MELHRISDVNKKAPVSPRDMVPNFDDRQMITDFDNIDTPAERSISFTLITDKDWKGALVLSRFSMDEDFYRSAKSFALSQNTNSGKFKLEDNYWAFTIKPHVEGYRIIFLDITSQQGILTQLTYTFALVALIMLVVIYFISRFFANKSIKPIKETFDKQKQFIADASHELKTPLAVINTNVDVLLSNGEESINNQSKWLYYIKSESERMTKLTNDLLYLTQVDYSEAKMIFTDFDLSQTVENIIMTMEAVIFEHKIMLEYNIEPNVTIAGNIEQIKQVIIILLDNAIKYTNANGVISIDLKKQSNYANLSVSNTSDGIPEEHIDRIFDRFYRVDKSRTRNSGGYGLGLSIAKAIIQQHGGKISAKSEVNKSTTFSIELPRK